MNLLHIDSSALGKHSVSRELSAGIVATLRAAAPGTRVTYRDLAAEPLPHWTPATDANDPATLAGQTALEEFLAADTVVIGAPMYNFAIASQLKAWLDRILVAGQTFRYTEHGPEGLSGTKRVIIALSRGGRYAEGTPAAALDFQKPYLQAIFAFIGIHDVEFVEAAGVNLGVEAKQAALDDARAAIADLAEAAAAVA